MANESRTHGRDRLSFSQDQPLNLNVRPASPLSGRSDSEVSRIRLTWHTVESTYQHGLRAPVVVDSTVDETVGHSQAPVAAIRGNRGQIPDLVASCTVHFPSQIPDLKWPLTPSSFKVAKQPRPNFSRTFQRTPGEKKLLSKREVPFSFGVPQFHNRRRKRWEKARVARVLHKEHS